MQPAYTIHLRSDSPSVLIEFILRPGTHARIGTSPYAEITLPLTGLAEIACTIGRTLDGQLYTEVPEGSEHNLIQLPAALHLPPYQFVIFEPANNSPAVRDASARRKKKPPYLLAAAAAVCVAVAGGIFFTVIASQTKSPGTPRPVSAAPLSPAPPPSNTTTATATPATPAAAQKPPVPLATSTTPAPPSPAAATTPAASPAKPTTSPDLQAIAERARTAVYKLDVLDDSGEKLSYATAFAIDPDGLIVTNHHAIKKGKSFTVTNSQGTVFPVTRIAAIDEGNDLAFLFFKATDIPVLELGKSDHLKIGYPISVYGTPKGFSGTLSTGILSARRESSSLPTIPADIHYTGQLLQISAPVSSGSSGSPVFDDTGTVIAVVSSIVTGTDTQNLNFAIPGEAVKKLLWDYSVSVSKKYEADKKPLSLGYQTPEQPAPSTKPSSPQKTPSPKTPPPSSEDKATPADRAFQKDENFLDIMAHMTLKEWQPMHKLCMDTIKRHPDSAFAHMFLGISYKGVGRYQQSKAALLKALSLRPNYAPPLGHLGMCQEELGEHEAARKSWNKLLVSEPQLGWVRERIILSYIKDSNIPEASHRLDAFAKFDEDACLKLWDLIKERAQKEHQFLNFRLSFESESNLAKPDAPKEIYGKIATVTASYLAIYSSQTNPDGEIACYADTVKPYFNRASATKATIAKEIRADRKRFPLREGMLLTWQLTRKIDADTIEVDALYAFSKRVLKEDEVNYTGYNRKIIFKRSGEKWLITSIQDTTAPIPTKN